MKKFYFTYAQTGHPFAGGWTEIEAPDMSTACTLFRRYHPDKTEGLLNCAFVYEESEFMKTPMYKESNFGEKCHEKITVESIKPVSGKSKKTRRT